MPARIQKLGAASRGPRVTGVATQQTVRPAPGVLQRIIVANADVATQTLTVLDGASTTLIVLRVAAGACVPFEFGIPFTTDLRVTPSNANIDALVVAD